MSRPTKLDLAAVDAFIAQHGGWKRTEAGAVAKEFKWPDFPSALAFVVRVGCVAEKRDHHPNIEFGWGRARVSWSTHDAGGVTQLDLEAAAATDALVG
jgi:4a-hydroxytetrahydrobiopterin dehydratase